MADNESLTVRLILAAQEFQASLREAEEANRRG